MRKALPTAMAAALLVAMMGGPATADPVDKTDSIPLDYTFHGWNPCTESEVDNHFVGELDIHALPSIEAFYNDAATHFTLKWTGQFVGSDGYSTQDKHYATQVVNIRPVDPPHVVVNEVDNIIFNGPNGGKVKVSARFHLTVVDGELKSEIDRFDERCIRQPRN